MVSLLGLGFLVGMRHAVEADHAAAVATLATQNHSVANTLKQGLTWGLGHTITLLLFGSMVFLLEAAVPERLANWLELAVGVILVGLGGDVLRKITMGRFHAHVHQYLSNLLMLMLMPIRIKFVVIDPFKRTERAKKRLLTNALICGWNTWRY